MLTSTAISGSVWTHSGMCAGYKTFGRVGERPGAGGENESRYHRGTSGVLEGPARIRHWCHGHGRILVGERPPEGGGLRRGSDSRCRPKVGVVSEQGH